MVYDPIEAINVLAQYRTALEEQNLPDVDAHVGVLERVLLEDQVVEPIVDNSPLGEINWDLMRSFDQQRGERSSSRVKTGFGTKVGKRYGEKELVDMYERAVDEIHGTVFRKHRAGVPSWVGPKTMRAVERYLQARGLTNRTDFKQLFARRAIELLRL